MLRVIGREDVARLLDYPACITVVRDAMRALSAGRTRQMLRQIIPVEGEDVLSAMAGVMPADIGFGAKIISVFPENPKTGRQSHQGVVVLFDAASGEPSAILHAGDITRIRTAAASALATDVLANPGASRLAVLGYGEQGQAHAEAIAHVRPLKSIVIWGRSPAEASRVATKLSGRLNIAVEAAASVERAVAGADIICTATASADPILTGDMVGDGVHLNLVGSSAGAVAEIDGALVVRARFFADHREGVLKQGGEYLRALAAGIVDHTHILGEIGDVLNGTIAGRTSPGQVTAYKSLGHVVQDLSSARFLVERARRHGGGIETVF